MRFSGILSGMSPGNRKWWSISATALLCPVISMAQLTTTSSPDVTRCVPGNVQLLTTPSGGTSYSYSWSPTTGLSNPFIANPVANPSLTTQYVVTVTDIPTSNTVKDTVLITIQNNPPPVAAFPVKDTICQGGSAKLTVVNSNNCQTVTGTCQAGSANHTIGTGNLLATGPIDNAFYKQSNILTSIRSVKHQYIFRASELKAGGMSGPVTLNGISLDVTLFTTIGMTYDNLTIKMGCISDSVMTSTFKTGLTTVYNPKTKSFTTTQWELFSFDQAFVWNGTSNIVVEICYVNSTASNNFPFVRYTVQTFVSSAHTSANAGVCSNTTGSLTDHRPNTRFHHCDIMHPNALTYSWAPATGLSSASVRNPTASPTTTTNYIVTVTDANGCYNTDTAQVSVAPVFSYSINNDTTLCGADTLLLKAVHSSGPGARIKWKSGKWIQNDTLAQSPSYIDDNVKVYFSIRSAAGCALSDSFRVNVIPPVQAAILTGDTTICSGDSIQIQLSTNSYSCGTYSSITCSSPSLLPITTSSTFASGGVIISPFDGNTVSTTPGQKKQLIFLASEMSALTNSHIISRVGFNVQSVGSTVTSRNGFTIKMGCTSQGSFTAFNAAFITGLQTVFNAKTINFSTGWNDFVFDNAFVWDGTSNVVIEICWQNPSSIGTGFNTLNYSIASFTCGLVNYLTSPACPTTNGSLMTNIRPDMRFSYCLSPPNSLYDFTWTPFAGLSSDTVPEPLASPASSTKYVLRVSDPISNCSAKDSIQINVAPGFSITPIPDTTLCEEDSLTLGVTHTSSLPVSYHWWPGASVTDSTIAAPSVYVAGANVYAIEVKSSMGCIKWDTVKVGLNDKLDISFVTPPGSACEGDSLPIDLVHTLKCGISNSYLCTPSSTLVLGNSTVTSSLFNVTPFVASDKSSKKQYLLQKSELVAAGMNSSAQLSSLTIEVTALGKADYQNFTIKMTCTGQTYLTGSYISGTKTVFGPEDIRLKSGKNTFIFDQRFNWDGNSNLVIEICHNSLATGSNSEVYSYIPSPTFNCTQYVRGNSVCANSSGTTYNRRPNLELGYCIVSPASYSYSWSPPGNFNNPALEDPIAVATPPGILAIDLTDLNSGCVISDTLNIDVRSFNVTALKDSALCSTLNYQLDATTTAVTPHYKWTPGSQLSNDTIRNPLITVSGGMNYILEVTDDSGCVKTDTVVIIQLPVPVANVSPPSATICREKGFRLTGSGGGSYSWKPSAGLDDSLAAAPLAVISSGTTYYLTVTNSFGCTDVDSVVLMVHPSPYLDLGPDTSYCVGGSFILSAGGQFASYNWQDNSTDTSVTVENNGVYWVKVIDGFNCAFSDTVDISLAPSPSSLLNYNTPVCVGDTAVLDAGNAGANYIWSTGAVTRTINVSDSGFFWVVIDNGQCVGMDSTRVFLEEYPVSDLKEIETYCEKEYPFGMELVAGGTNYRYAWSTGEVNNSIIVTDEGKYSVVISNDGRCPIEMKTDVRHLCSEVILVPNSFTPNSDWKNDMFSIVALNMDEFEFRIYTRWGELIYHSENPEFKWDGKFEGMPLPEGVYVWRIDYSMRLIDGSIEEREAMGTITLLR